MNVTFAELTICCPRNYLPWIEFTCQINIFGVVHACWICFSLRFNDLKWQTRALCLKCCVYVEVIMIRSILVLDFFSYLRNTYNILFS